MKSGTFWGGILVGLILAGAFFFISPYLGIFNMAASGEKNILDWWGGVNLHSAVELRAPESEIPAKADPEKGFKIYKSRCLHCHGAPDEEREKWANHMLPKPPELWKKETREHMPDGQFFYIIGNGIRMSGMPAFEPVIGEEDVWNMVAFIRNFEKFSGAQKADR